MAGNGPTDLMLHGSGRRESAGPSYTSVDQSLVSRISLTLATKAAA